MQRSWRDEKRLCVRRHIECDIDRIPWPCIDDVHAFTNELNLVANGDKFLPRSGEGMSQYGREPFDDALGDLWLIVSRGLDRRQRAKHKRRIEIGLHARQS